MADAVTWYKGVRELTYSKRHRVMTELGNSYMMQIKSVLQTDPGEYTAVATNGVGQAHVTVFVNVLPKHVEYVQILYLQSCTNICSVYSSPPPPVLGGIVVLGGGQRGAEV